MTTMPTGAKGRALTAESSERLQENPVAFGAPVCFGSPAARRRFLIAHIGRVISRQRVPQAQFGQVRPVARYTDLMLKKRWEYNGSMNSCGAIHALQ